MTIPNGLLLAFPHPPKRDIVFFDEKIIIMNYILVKLFFTPPVIFHHSYLY
jgi:hypothetical protein